VQEQLEQGKQGDEGAQEMELKLESSEGQAGDLGEMANGDLQDELSKAAEGIADDLTEKFEKEMGPIMESVEAAMEHFGNFDELLDGPQGWDLTKGVWKESGWREFQNLRKKLQNLRELRDLVRTLTSCAAGATLCGLFMRILLQ
jgi:uncharacterized protein with von Willebrand factor type A (vWA) domain